MKRRDLLAALGAGTAALSGCSVLGGDDPEPSLTPVEVPETATPTPTPREIAELARDNAACEAVAGEDSPDPPPVADVPAPSERFESLVCPAVSWASETVCFHTADRSREPVVLFGEDSTAYRGDTDGDRGKATFALVNRRGSPVRIQPTRWSVLRPDGTPRGWSVVAAGDPGCLRAVESGGYHRWRLGVDETVLAPTANATALQVRLDPGRYLFAVPVVSPNGADRVCVAPFEVRPPNPPSPTPADRVTAHTPSDGVRTPKNVTDDR